MQRSILSIILAFLIAITSCVCLASPGEENGEQPDRPVKPRAPLTFRASGQAQAAPENVVIHFAVVGDADTLVEAEQQMQKTEQSIIGALEKNGIKRKEMQLEQFAAIPHQPGIISTDAMKPLGYRVQRQYKITMPIAGDSLDKALIVANVALEQGARPVSMAAAGYDTHARWQVSLMEFTVKEPEKLTQQAMADALARARKLAEQAAGEMGYAPGAIKLIAVHASEVSVGPNHYDSPEDRVPMTIFSWQAVRATVSIEAEFDVK